MREFRAKLSRGEPVFGPMILDLASPGLPAIFTAGGADFIVYDMEAGCLDIASVKMQIGLCRGLSIAPLVNVASQDYAMVMGPLDCGAAGLMIPVVENGAQAERLGRLTHYPPEGVRGVAFGIAQDDYEGAPTPAGLTRINESLLVLAKVETASGIANIEDILGAPGIDGAFLGHMDLSASLGAPGEYESADFGKALEKLVSSCRRLNKVAACLVTTPAGALQRLSQGFRVILYSTDVLLLREGFSTQVGEIRRGWKPA
jgi:2-keto-3-deoxy-L-rhamnonate aldolase RhmA